FRFMDILFRRRYISQKSKIQHEVPDILESHSRNERVQYWPYFNSLMIASAALPATTQLADPATTASSSNHRNPKSSMHSGKSGLIMIYPGITAPGMYELSARLLL